MLALIVATLPLKGASADTWMARDATYQVIVEKDVRVTMSDGMRLAVDVLHPATDGQVVPGRFPVLLTQTPYNKGVSGVNFRTDYLVTRGYVQVIADVRGTGGSEGVWDSFGTREQLDGAELVAWAASQPWSSGDVGLHGTSYAAINQIFTAAQQPAGLRALFPIVPAGDVFRDIVGTGGQMNVEFIPLWLGLVTGLGLLPPTYAATDPVGALTTLAAHAGNALNFQSGTVLRAMTGGETSFDGPFYRQRSPIEVVDRIEVPTFLAGGWFDLFQRGTPMLFERLHARGVPSRLVMGPWYHITPAIESGLPRDGVPTLDELELRWMDRYVRGDADPGLDTDTAPVTAFRLLDDGYQTFSEWPPAAVHYEAFHTSGPAVAGIQAGSLRATAPAVDTLDSLAWQPLGGLCSRSPFQWGTYGPRQPLCEEDERANLIGGLTYDLPLTEDLTIAGPISLTLDVETNDRDAFIVARLEDVAPGGAVTHLTTGWQMLSMRALSNGRSVWEDGLLARPYHPFTRASQLGFASGERYQVSVELFGTFARIPAGHTLRLSLQSSDTPHLAPSIPSLSNLVGSVLSVHPSTLALPILG